MSETKTETLTLDSSIAFRNPIRNPSMRSLLDLQRAGLSLGAAAPPLVHCSWPPRCVNRHRRRHVDANFRQDPHGYEPTHTAATRASRWRRRRTDGGEGSSSSSSGLTTRPCACRCIVHLCVPTTGKTITLDVESSDSIEAVKQKVRSSEEMAHRRPDGRDSSSSGSSSSGARLASIRRTATHSPPPALHCTDVMLHLF